MKDERRFCFIAVGEGDDLAVLDTLSHYGEEVDSISGSEWQEVKVGNDIYKIRVITMVTTEKVFTKCTKSVNGLRIY